MRLGLVLCLGGVLFAQASYAPRAIAADLQSDPAAGRAKAGMCRTCHGLDGRARIPVAPNIGGEPADYIVRQLVAFRDGTRTNEMMSVVAASLDDQAIADLAAWYSSHQATGSLPPGADPANAPEACAACHGVAGIAEVEDVPNLAGENSIYIATQLKAFRSGKRTHEIMSEIAAGLSDNEIRDLADWYGTTKLGITSPE
jgi:cytochrome c553